MLSNRMHRCDATLQDKLLGQRVKREIGDMVDEAPHVTARWLDS